MNMLELSRKDERTCRADNLRLRLLCARVPKLFANVRTQFDIRHNMVRLDHELGGLLHMIRTDVFKPEPSVPSALVRSCLSNTSAGIITADEKVEAVHHGLFRCDSGDVERRAGLRWDGDLDGHSRRLCRSLCRLRFVALLETAFQLKSLLKHLELRLECDGC